MYSSYIQCTVYICTVYSLSIESTGYKCTVNRLCIHCKDLTVYSFITVNSLHLHSTDYINSLQFI